MKNKQTKLLILSALMLAVISPSYADFGIVAGVGKNNGYKDLDSSTQGGIGFQYRGEKFNAAPFDGMSYDFTNSNKYAVEALLTSKNGGYKAKDSTALKGMGKKHPSIDIGGRVIMDTGYGNAVFDLTKDVNASKGVEAQLKLGGIGPHASHWDGQREFTVTPVAGVRYQSAKVVDYYYGVKGSEATGSRKAYKAKSAITPFVGLEAQAKITSHFSVDAGLGISKRSSSVRNSPLTSDRKYETSANIGLTYWF